MDLSWEVISFFKSCLYFGPLLRFRSLGKVFEFCN